jgi:hypothetical protein
MRAPVGWLSMKSRIASTSAYWKMLSPRQTTELVARGEALGHGHDLRDAA